MQPRELHERTAAARAERDTESWRTKYALRARVEGTVSQALDVAGIRRARYRGLPKVRLHAPSPPPRSTSSGPTLGGPSTHCVQPAPADSNASATDSPADAFSNGVSRDRSGPIGVA
ncbi:transposase [Streptomyces sp. NPDC085540]|uniref:transposase n=1 Tax=Streptomyces sp. NPDC085540 TaxID=3365730 RepID=UPI0037CF95CA